MWKCAKSAGRISRQDYECISTQIVQEEFEDQTINVEACEECRKNFKTRTMTSEACKECRKNIKTVL